MTRITWDDTGTRIFETGIDRGMLYPPEIPGVAWQGLTKVTEAPVGGVSREYYLDGQKILDIPSLEEYTATIEAFSAPEDFNVCEGKLEIAPGLYATDQPRKTFGFSYRTLVGDDVKGLDAGYKIHLVYNVLPKTSNVTYQSASGKADPKMYSWGITAVSEATDNYRPTAHYVIDTRRIGLDVVEAIEDILYGTDVFNPRMLTVKELVALTTTGLLPPPPVGGVAVSMKKLKIFAVGAGISRISSTAVKMKKLKISGGGQPPVSGEAPYIDLLPYLIGTGAIGTGDLTLVVGTGDNGGWPALPGDTLIACGGTGGAQPTGITDNKGNVYTKRGGTSASPASSIWTCVANSSGLQTATGPRGVKDTTTITYAATTQAKQWTIFGCRNLGAIDQIVTPTTGTSAAPSITSGTPAQANELFIVCVAHQTATTINVPAGWRKISQDITSGANAHTSTFVKISRTASAVTFTASLSGSVSWSCQMISFRPAAISLKGKVGCMASTGAYPGELSPNNNWQAHLRWQTVTSRPANSIKRYMQEDDTAASATNDIEGIVGTWSSLLQVVTIKCPRAVGGGTAAGLQTLKDSLTWWRNNGLDLQINVGNEVQIFGADGPFGNGSQKNWQKACPYNTTDINQAKQNWFDYWDWYAPTVISAGYPAMYCPSMVSETAAVDWLPPRLSSDGHPYLCGASLDYYAASDWIGSKQITLVDIIAACDAMTPPCPIGISETGGSNGANWDPIHNDPAGTLAGPGRNLIDFLDDQVTAKFSTRPARYLRNLHFIWFANGLKNSLDTDTDSRIISAWQRLYDALNG